MKLNGMLQVITLKIRYRERKTLLIVCISKSIKLYDIVKEEK